MWLKSSANRKRIRLFRIWTRFVLFCFKFLCAWLWLAEKFLQKCRWFFFFVIATRLSGKAMCSITAKQHNCWFLVLKRNIQNVEAGFAHFTVVETFIGWNVNTLFVSTCWTVRISNSLLYFVVHTQFFLSVFGWLKWDTKEHWFVRLQVHTFWQKNEFCLFLSSLRAPVMWGELCEQTTKPHTFHNHKNISELLHNHQ